MPPSVATLSMPSCDPDRWLSSGSADGMFATSSRCYVFGTPSYHRPRTGFRPSSARGSVKCPAIEYANELDVDWTSRVLALRRQASAPSGFQAVDVRFGSDSTFRGRRRRVRFTPDTGRIAATQRTDASKDLAGEPGSGRPKGLADFVRPCYSGRCRSVRSTFLGRTRWCVS